jgi:uncharacterized protein
MRIKNTTLAVYAMLVIFIAGGVFSLLFAFSSTTTSAISVTTNIVKNDGDKNISRSSQSQSAKPSQVFSNDREYMRRAFAKKYGKKYGYAFFTLGESVFDLQVAHTASTRQRGLSGRSYIAPREGMLFSFQEDNTHGFWMKDMKIPIDIIWLDSTFTVVHIESDITPGTYPQTFYPTKPARYVLEIASGGASRNGIKIGSQLPITVVQ